jgi:sugar phosphate isomerase/epimerase
MNPLWTRRQFLGATAASAVAACAWPRAAWAIDEDRERFGGFLVGLQSYSFRNFPVDKTLDMIQELGLRAVEFYPGQFPINSTDEQIATMKQKCESHGIKIMGHGVNAFGANKDANRKIFDFAKRAGIRNLSADPSPESFANLDELVEEFDIRIAIHNHGPTHRYNKVEDVLKAIQGHDKRIGACADLGHYIRSGEDPVEVIRRLEGRLYGVHLKDFAEQAAKTKGVLLGKGHLDVEAVFKALHKVNFPADGCLSIEYEENPKDPFEDVKQCVAIASAAAIKAAAS